MSELQVRYCWYAQLFIFHVYVIVAVVQGLKLVFLLRSNMAK